MDFIFLLTIVPAYLVGSFFIKHDPGEREPKKAIHSAIWFGVLAVALALAFSLLFEAVLSGNALDRLSGIEEDTILPLFLDVLIFATLEELVKFIPIAFFLLRKSYFNEHTDGIIYFSIVGLTFGAIESLLYSFTAGDFGFVVAIMRLIIALFFHGALTSIVGYYFARAKILGHGMGVAFVVLGLVSLVHTGYNYAVYSTANEPLYIFVAAGFAIGANALMFWLYFVGTKEDIKLGLAGSQYADARALEEEQRRQAYIQSTQPQAPVQYQQAPQHPAQPPAPQQPQATQPGTNPPDQRII